MYKGAQRLRKSQPDRQTRPELLRSVILTQLGDIDSVFSIESTFVMSEVKQKYGINF